MKNTEKGLTRHLIANVILLLVAVSAILMLSGRENYARQMEAYIQGLSGRTAQHASDVFCG